MRKSRVKERDEPELASASCSLSRPDPAALSCLHPRRWKRFHQNELLRLEGAEGGRRGGRRGEELGTGCTAGGATKSRNQSGVSKQSMEGNAHDAVADSRFSEFSPLWSLHSHPTPPPHHRPLLLLSPTHHPPALCAPPQKSWDSWKVLGVYSVTTKQNHLKTKWAGECAGAIRARCLCGRGEKRPLRIKGMDGRSGRGGDGGWGGRTISIHRLSTHTPTQTQF